MVRNERERAVPALSMAVGLLAVLGLLGAGFGIALAQTGGAADETYSPFSGKISYKTYCMNCHGVDGRGDGYLADSLKKKPTDLTVLAKKNDGAFPAERLWASIDGREAIKAHGTREMPVWGDAFLWPDTSPERQAEAKRKIGELVEYVRSIQDPPASK